MSGYESTLKPHHGFVTRNVFSVAVKAAPYRKDFIAKLGESEDAVLTELGEAKKTFEATIGHLKGFLVANKIETK
jgi:hypothetical protein